MPALGRPTPPASAAILLRRLVSVEVLLVAAAVAVAAVLSSLPPPPKALATIGSATAHTGPGPVTEVVTQHGFRLEFHVDPNRAAVPNEFAVRIDQAGRPVSGADVTASFTMLDMEMQQQSYKLSEASPGLYEHSAPRARDGGALGAVVRDHAAHWRAVHRPPRRPGERMRRALLVLVAAVAACVLAGNAGADGDPASDYLLGLQTFIPYDLKLPAAKQKELSSLVHAANSSGYAIRVAVIGSAYDMGAVTSLWQSRVRTHGSSGPSCNSSTSIGCSS